MLEAPPLPGQDIHAGVMPEIVWGHGDDLCDCTFQQVGDWTNPYIGRTLRVRLCCIWARLFSEYPQFVQEIPAYYDQNTDRWETDPMDWNVEDSDMPVHIWHRQIAVLTGLSLPEVRKHFEGEQPPKAVADGTGVRLISDG